MGLQQVLDRAERLVQASAGAELSSPLLGASMADEGRTQLASRRQAMV
jgi:hypothetical protein